MLINIVFNCKNELLNIRFTPISGAEYKITPRCLAAGSIEIGIGNSQSFTFQSLKTLPSLPPQYSKNKNVNKFV
jgi:hypothetical protein